MINTTILRRKFPTTTLILVLSVLFISSCDRGREMESNKNEESIKETLDKILKQESFGIDDELYIESGPVPPRQTSTAFFNFVSLYGLVNPGINTTDVIVNLDQLILSKILAHQSSRENGLAFHYALSADKKNVYYIISPATYDLQNEFSTFTAFPSDNFSPVDYYILLKSDGGGAYEIIDQSDFCIYTERYANNINMSFNGLMVPISSIRSPQYQFEHPKYVYHEGIELFKFYSAYEVNTPTQLSLRHCANAVKPVTEIFHVPHLLFTVESSRNMDYTDMNLDLGHLCPPKCNANPPVTCLQQ